MSDDFTDEDNNSLDLRTLSPKDSVVQDLTVELQEFSQRLTAGINLPGTNAGHAAAPPLRRPPLTAETSPDGENSAIGESSEIGTASASPVNPGSTSPVNWLVTENNEGQSRFDGRNGSPAATGMAASVRSSATLSDDGTTSNSLAADFDQASSSSTVPELLTRIANETARQSSLLEYLRQDWQDWQARSLHSGTSGVEL